MEPAVKASLAIVALVLVVLGWPKIEAALKEGVESARVDPGEEESE